MVASFVICSLFKAFFILEGYSPVCVFDFALARPWYCSWYFLCAYTVARIPYEIVIGAHRPTRYCTVITLSLDLHLHMTSAIKCGTARAAFLRRRLLSI